MSLYEFAGADAISVSYRIFRDVQPALAKPAHPKPGGACVTLQP